MQDASPGAEVWAWFKPDTKDVSKNWKELANSLSGLVCASLNFIDTPTSISPRISFRPSGVVGDNVNSTYLRYATLPREIVCTENLTPWKKLLPCDSKRGLAELLNAGYIHNTRYHSVAIHVRPVCKDKECKSQILELQQTVSLVYDSLLLGSRDWSIRKLFGQGIIHGGCPLAESSNIYVDLSTNDTAPYHLNPKPDEVIISKKTGFETSYAKYNVQNHRMISALYMGQKKVVINNPPPIYGSQYRVGLGQQKGGIVNKLYNNHWTALDVVLMQNVPWFVPIYMHTLKIESGGKMIQPKDIKYTPGNLREKPHCVELVITLPARSTTTVSINFDFVFLKWQEYPPDANHGFYIGSAVISAILPLAKNYTGVPQDGSTISDSFNATRDGYLVQIRTESMVITLPTPDFSMPYNVICLACTVVALAFGPLHNITTKRLCLKVVTKGSVVDRVRTKLGMKPNETEGEDADKKDN